MAPLSAGARAFLREIGYKIAPGPAGEQSADLAMPAEATTIDARALAERDRVLRILGEQAPRLRASGITRLSLFGSMARGEAGPESDIDLLIETDPEARLGFFELFALKEGLETLLERSVQFAFGVGMRPWLRECIKEDRIACNPGSRLVSFSEFESPHF